MPVYRGRSRRGRAPSEYECPECAKRAFEDGLCPKCDDTPKREAA